MIEKLDEKGQINRGWRGVIFFLMANGRRNEVK